jgi:methionine-rich copper-binding protein CopC
MPNPLLRARLSLATVLLLSSACLPAYAHADLVQTVPAQEEPVAAPLQEIRLTFTEGVELAFSDVSIIAGDQKEVELGELSLDPNDNKTLVVPIESELDPGAYTVQWTVVSADGHKMEGEYLMDIVP